MKGATVWHLPYSDAFDAGSNWICSTTGGSSWQLGVPNYGSTNGVHSGSAAWDVELNSAYRDSSRTMLCSPVITMTGEYNAVLSFWQNRNTEDFFDGFCVQYSVNAGSTWNVLGQPGDSYGVNWYNRPTVGALNSAGWSGSSGGWIRSSYTLIPLNGYSGPVQFRFLFASNDSLHSDGVSIDDFSIDPAPLKDAKLLSIGHPALFTAAGDADSVKLVVRNNGGHLLQSEISIRPIRKSGSGELPRLR